MNLQTAIVVVRPWTAVEVVIPWVGRADQEDGPAKGAPLGRVELPACQPLQGEGGEGARPSHVVDPEGTKAVRVHADPGQRP